MQHKAFYILCALLTCAFLATACDDEEGGGNVTDTGSGDGTSGTTTDSSSGTTDSSSGTTDSSSGTTDSSSGTTDSSSGTTDSSSSGTDTTADIDTVEPPSPECTDYCDTMLENCADVFADEDACLNACEDMPVAGSDQTSGDSVECRAYHGEVAGLGDPGFHCPHASPDGGGVCTDTPEPTPCDRYCVNFFAGCGPEGLDVSAALLYPGADAAAQFAACITACGTFDDTGSFGDSSGDTRQCRDYYAQLATTDAAGRPSHCLAAREDGGGVCAAADADLQLDRMGRPAIATALIASPNKEAYNRATPAEGEFFADEMVAFLGVYDGLDGAAGGAAIFPAVALGPYLSIDHLLINIDIDDCTDGYLAVDLAALGGVEPTLCGGRTFPQDVVDVTLQALVDASGATPVTDHIDSNDNAFLATFPYLAAPN